MGNPSSVSSPQFHQKRRPLRRFLQWISRVAFWLLTDLTIEGKENFPESGPLLVVGNHFSFIDPAVFVHIAPKPIDFIAGTLMPHTPGVFQFLPRLWGVLPVYRGTGSRNALMEAEKILNNGGILGMFPEAGAWAEILRPARPGASFLSSRTGAPLLPIGIDGLPDVFPNLARLRKARVTIKIGKPFGPLIINGRESDNRQQMDKFSHLIMHRIAELIPQDKAGLFSTDPAIREAAQGTDIYPWSKTRETLDEYHAPKSG
jgi:1-acyl-sn-glycerol-3-phosphate acyltransferase